MNNYTFKDKNGVNYRRITKSTARKAFYNGLTVVICPSNLRPFTPWHCETDLNINNDAIKTEIENGFIKRENVFNYLINQFEFYNCSNTETGRRCNYYIAENERGF